MLFRSLIVTDPEIQRDEVVQEHIYAKKPTVLISPSLHTGLDLKEDLSRFQIITKVPYPNKSDRWINAKRNKVPDWYYWQTGLKLIQAYGRSVRSKDDWARTYILDSAFEYFLRKNREILPGWFLNAIKNRGAGRRSPGRSETPASAAPQPNCARCCRRGCGRGPLR